MTMHAVASMGAAELLLLMLLACAIELRLRSSAGHGARRTARPTRFRDGLTGLPTRSTFEGTLAQALHWPMHTPGTVVLLHDRAGRLQAHQRQLRPPGRRCAC